MEWESSRAEENAKALYGFIVFCIAVIAVTIVGKHYDASLMKLPMMTITIVVVCLLAVFIALLFW